MAIAILKNLKSSKIFFFCMSLLFFYCAETCAAAFCDKRRTPRNGVTLINPKTLVATVVLEPSKKTIGVDEQEMLIDEGVGIGKIMISQFLNCKKKHTNLVGVFLSSHCVTPDGRQLIVLTMKNPGESSCVQ